MPKVITVHGTEYLVKYPVGALIRAEMHLGKPISRLDTHTMTYLEMSILTRYGLHNLDEKPISEDEFDRLLEEISPIEFATVFADVVSEISPPDEEPGKN